MRGRPDPQRSGGANRPQRRSPPRFRHRRLPGRSAFLAGRGPLDSGIGVLTERMQIYWRRGDDLAPDARPHAHRICDECFVVLSGAMVVEVDGAEHVVGPREWCFFPAGLFHRIVRVEQPLEALILRAPGIGDKVVG